MYADIRRSARKRGKEIKDKKREKQRCMQI